MENIHITQEEIISSGPWLKAAPAGTWRVYDESNPVPKYFDFDWLSGRYPDLYHQFAVSSDGLLEKLHMLIDLTGCDVLDIGAGTGRSAVGAAQKAASVVAMDLYQSVIRFGNNLVRQNHIPNVQYLNGDREHIPFAENSFDVVINTWAELNPHEAWRVLKPDGFLIQMGSTLDGLCGELTSTLRSEFPWLVQDCAPAGVYAPDYPDVTLSADASMWGGVPLKGPIQICQFTYVSHYKDCEEIAAMVGRLYGPKAKKYFLDRCQSTFAWRLQINIGQASK